MKKLVLFLLVASLAISGSLFGLSNKRNVEVLYFKANLACCKATACNALEGNIRSIIEREYPEGNVTFKVIKITEEQSKELVDKYKAQSQTVVIVSRKRKKEASVDISGMVSQFAKDNNKEKFGSELTGMINAGLK